MNRALKEAPGSKVIPPEGAKARDGHETARRTPERGPAKHRKTLLPRLKFSASEARDPRGPWQHAISPQRVGKGLANAGRVRHLLRGGGNACVSPAGTPAGTRAVTLVSKNARAEERGIRARKVPSVPRIREVEEACLGLYRGAEQAEGHHRWGEHTYVRPPIALRQVDRESSILRLRVHTIGATDVASRDFAPGHVIHPVSFTYFAFWELASSSPVHSRVNAYRLFCLSSFFRRLL